MPTTLLHQHFWLLVGLWCGVGTAVYYRMRLRKRIDAGEFTKREVETFTRNYALWFLLPCVALWLLQQSLEPQAPPYFLDWRNPQKLMAIGLLMFIWSALLYWTFAMNGATVLSRYSRAVGRSASMFNSPLVFKLTVAAVVLAGLLALFSQRA